MMLLADKSFNDSAGAFVGVDWDVGKGCAEEKNGESADCDVEERRAAGAVVDGEAGCGVGGTANWKKEVEVEIFFKLPLWDWQRVVMSHDTMTWHWKGEGANAFSCFIIIFFFNTAQTDFE
ncbi:uncharacterized protein MONOS_12553 [Monocercomonoides exilis]|uniref:uncharacterized protein n=1 Tax=Monocercomonoides exilis TaxID=2049356 RepID=UPI00355A94C2|nr:hypothetical protein MONOS_12553 [Monocercomonoides exilis]|eukprot:MONOS_12553.1-p1 / transcript=MONOS_12553.1 / gene=MONOS_12553 / organism=Monocercomonoides_exilis_PA203 / gene_product=unspecified product / transcript_product=unspecified product / location=Mono_scaffold00701:13496-13931(+) / protein_length=121 / sequence_SO=supercontig / SO=protein_coding / is_pseudo=false